MPYQANRRVHGMPPSLLVTNTREALLSSTAVFCEALLRRGTKPSRWSMKHYRARFGIAFRCPRPAHVWIWWRHAMTARSRARFELRAAVGYNLAVAMRAGDQEKRKPGSSGNVTSTPSAVPEAVR